MIILICPLLDPIKICVAFPMQLITSFPIIIQDPAGPQDYMPQKCVECLFLRCHLYFILERILILPLKYLVCKTLEETHLCYFPAHSCYIVRKGGSVE